VGFIAVTAKQTPINIESLWTHWKYLWTLIRTLQICDSCYRRWFNLRLGQKTFLFSKASMLCLGPLNLLCDCFSGLSSRWVKRREREADHSPQSSAEVKERIIISILTHAVLAYSVDDLTRDYILITNLMHWLLFIHKILFSSTCFEPQVLIFRRIQLYTCSIWYCHSLEEFVVACRSTGHHVLWQYHMLHVYNFILLKMSTWGSKHIEENNILWINNNQCNHLVINI